MIFVLLRTTARLRHLKTFLPGFFVSLIRGSKGSDVAYDTNIQMWAYFNSPKMKAQLLVSNLLCWGSEAMQPQMCYYNNS